MRRALQGYRRLLLGPAVALAVSASSAGAQIQGASSAGLATANNYTARARGFAALGLDPAALGLDDSPAYSVAILPVGVQAGLDPVSLGDLKDFEGRTIPEATKNLWLARIRSSGGQSVVAGARLTGISLAVGHFGFEASTLGRVRARLTEPAAELLLFGNAGRTGSPADLSLAGSSVQAWAVTTLGVSAGLPLDVRIGRFSDQSFAVGATMTYYIGNALFLGRENDGSVSSDPLEVDVQFPMLQTDTAFSRFNNGSGVGLDVGAAWVGGPWEAALAVRNLVNTFRWDLGGLFFRPGLVRFNQSSKLTDIDAVKARGTPAASELLAEAANQRFDPTLVAAVAYRAYRRVTVMGEVRRHLGNGMNVEPGSHVGIGIEARPLRVVVLRAGVAKITGGAQVGTGAAVAVGPASVSGAYLYQSGDPGHVSAAQLTISFGAR